MEIEQSKSPIWLKFAKVSLDMFCALDENGTFIHVNEASKGLLGYDPEALIGRSFREFIHPDFIQVTEQIIVKILQGSTPTNFENYYYHKNRETIPILWSAKWSEEDQLMFCVARNLKEQKKNKLKLEESEERYRAFFENSPDIIYLENSSGLVTEVNQNFYKEFELAQEDVINHPASSFLPANMVSVSELSLQEALRGSTMRCDLQIQTKNKGQRIFDTIKFPIKVKGEIIAVQTIMKEITPMVEAYQTIQQQATKLNTIFESITDAFFTLDTNWNFTYINAEFDAILKTDRTQIIGKNIWNIFTDEVGKIFYQQYHLAAVTGKAVHFEAFYAKCNLWIEVKAFPSSEGLSVYFNDITERTKIKKENEKLSLVASRTTNSVIITGAQGFIEWVNDSFVKITGYTLQEVIGKKPGEVLQGPETELETVKRVRQKLREKKPFTEEILNYKKSGEKFWMFLEITPVLDEQGEVTQFVAIQNNITKRKKEGEELAKLSLVASKTNNSVLIVDKDWEIQWVNEGFTRLFGYSLPEVLGKRPHDILSNSKTDESKYHTLTPKLMRGEPISFEILNVKKDGEEIWVNVDITSIFQEGNIIKNFIIVQTDITALKNSQIELSVLSQDLYRKNSDLQQFTYIVSHNLRAPVANAMGITDALTKLEKDNELYNIYLSNLTISIKQLDNVLWDMNTILGIRGKSDTLELEKVEVITIINQVVSFYQDTFTRINATLALDVEEGIMVIANKAYLYSVLYNLFSNAIKYKADDRNLQMQVLVHSTVGKGEKVAVFTISDNGSGFDMKRAKNQVFNLYKRFHNKQEGRGIGLFLTKTHIEAMGGTIEVESQKGIGTTFKFYLKQ
ncbi:PAS domain-containing sensor histidine kinase [Adhaeribacter aquaticus]|uniref:PAS domain-containing sensor histidine kinase n=1 Tax=Adhaeribacter aquaticus TaxID=299567 RepID=UPI00047AEACD|nr:PAS domain-containing sensor histidine kinase [Adhaeribacter aquaticus]